MRSYNFWVGMSTAFRDELEALLKEGTPPVQFPLLTNMSEDTRLFFSATYDTAAQGNKYPVWNSPGGKDFTMLSFYVNKPENVQNVRNDIDAMESTYGSDFTICGAWKCADGEQLGGDESPLYPSPALTLNFMPDDIIDPGDPTAEPPVPPTTQPATQLKDGLLLFGQAKRHFTIF